MNSARMHQRQFFTEWTPTIWFLILFFALAIIALIAAPILAFTWLNIPFPGFLSEQTLVVTDINGKEWEGYSAGIRYPQRILQIDQAVVDTPGALNSILSSYRTGDFVNIKTVTQEDEIQEYASIALKRFPIDDFLRIFWLPYLLGLVYLGISAWVFKTRGNTLAGRSFFYFCITSSTAMVLLFDLYTTHLVYPIWVIAVAQQGGALISLGLLFPEVTSPIKRYPWIRFIPYVLSATLAVWSIFTARDLTNPWDYITAWRFIYFYTSIGILFFIGMMLFRLRTTRSTNTRQQIRIILWGSVFSFAPLGLWFSAPLFNLYVRWNPSIFLPFLLLFPASIAIAIVRYKLWQVDHIINRTMVYSVLSVLLLVVYFTVIMVFQNLITTLSGTRSEFSNIFATIIIVVLFIPLRSRIQLFVDNRFYRKKYDAVKTFTNFSKTTRDEIDLNRLSDYLVEVVNETFEPKKVLFVLLDLPRHRSDFIEISPDDALIKQFAQNPRTIEIFHATPASVAGREFRTMGFRILSPVISHEQVLGILALGDRRSEQDYTKDDLLLLDTLANQIAPIVKVAQYAFQREAEAVERQQIEHEMQVARLIQQTLLPKQPPDIPNWEIAVQYKPARAVGGDFYDFFPLPDNRLVLTIGDVTDKGVPAALLMATTRAILRGAARRMFTPTQALSFANEILIHEMPEYMFVTCLYAILDTTSGRLQYANAGHILPCLARNRQACELKATGMPLGLLPETIYEEKETFLQPGDGLLLCSDGIVEAHSPKNEMFGFSRLLEIMKQHEDGKPLVDEVLHELNKFTGSDWAQEDDITIMTLHWLPNQQESIPLDQEIITEKIH